MLAEKILRPEQLDDLSLTLPQAPLLHPLRWVHLQEFVAPLHCHGDSIKKGYNSASSLAINVGVV
jgi:hypothetical protein